MAVWLNYSTFQSHLPSLLATPGVGGRALPGHLLPGGRGPAFRRKRVSPPAGWPGQTGPALGRGRVQASVCKVSQQCATSLISRHTHKLITEALWHTKRYGVVFFLPI